MTVFQKIIKYLAMAFAIFLVVSIIGGILSAVGIIGGFLDNDTVLDKSKTYEISSDITSLNIKINAADFTIEQSDHFSVESNLKHLSVTEKDGTLIIEDTKKFANTYNGAALTLRIPKEAELQTVKITTGAGRLSIDYLTAESINLELGAGEAVIQSLTASKNAEINGGAGKITISGGYLSNLDLEMGVGQLNLTSAILGNSSLELGVGESNLTLIGGDADYSLDIEKGIGSITVNGDDVSNYKSGSGQNKIDINGGVGAIHVDFKNIYLNF